MQAKLFCQTAAGQANKPGQSTKIVQLQAVLGTPASDGKEAVPGPNAKLFATVDVGNITFNLAGLSKEAFAEFSEGQCYKVTIEACGPND